MSLVLLTFIAPARLEDDMVELLLSHPQLASGFTVSAAEGHGSDLAFQGIADQVRGREKRVRIECVIDAAQAQALASLVKNRLPNCNIVFWVASLMEFGKC
ncbi:MAG: DUF3240 family protein [Thiobacillaceae bacterium]|jgi:hypothetical protein